MVELWSCPLWLPQPPQIPPPGRTVRPHGCPQAPPHLHPPAHPAGRPPALPPLPQNRQAWADKKGLQVLHRRVIHRRVTHPLPSKTPRRAWWYPQVEVVDIVLNTKWSLLSALNIIDDSTLSTEKHSVSRQANLPHTGERSGNVNSLPICLDNLVCPSDHCDVLLTLIGNFLAGLLLCTFDLFCFLDGLLFITSGHMQSGAQL